MMVSKLLPVGLMIGGLVFSVQTANAQGGYGSGCSSGAPVGPPPAGWNGPSSYQPGPNQAAPAPPPPPMRPSTQFNGQTNGQFNAQAQPNNGITPANGQMAQSNNQAYQSFSAEPAPVYPSAPAPTYSYPAFGGYNGYYANPYNGGFYGYGNGSWRRWDNAGDHGIPSY
jgi:hypothetical protein